MMTSLEAGDILFGSKEDGTAIEWHASERRLTYYSPTANVIEEPLSVAPITHHCAYCGQTSPDDRRGGCGACGGPREYIPAREDKPLPVSEREAEFLTQGGTISIDSCGNRSYNGITYTTGMMTWRLGL